MALTTFGASADEWRRAESELRPWMPGTGTSRRGPGTPFASDAGVERLFARAGLIHIWTSTMRLPVTFNDADHYLCWSRSVAQRVAWELMPQDECSRVEAVVAEHLAPAADQSGRMRVWQDVRCTVGERPTTS